VHQNLNAKTQGAKAAADATEGGILSIRRDSVARLVCDGDERFVLSRVFGKGMTGKGMEKE
jgi:hypothetical protein